MGYVQPSPHDFIARSVSEEGTRISFKPDKAPTAVRAVKCKAQTKAGKPCRAPAVERGLCFFHAHPEKVAELGRQGGRRNRHWSPLDQEYLRRSLRTCEDVQQLLEETVNRVRQGPFDLRAANSIGFLAGILLKALERGRVEERLSHLEAILAGNPVNETELFNFAQRGQSEHE